MLSTGIKAPDFTLPDQNGKLHSLKDYAGRRLLIYFYAKDNTSGCTKQAVGYSAINDLFKEKGVEVIGVSKDSVSSHKGFEQKQNLTITLLSDNEKSMIQAYDVWKEKKLYGNISMGVLRTTYLIDENGIIMYANDKVRASDDADNMLKII